jgi:predicted outer membrane repeat protein
MNNSAIFAGGAIYSGLIAVSTSTFTGNVADAYGGAISSAATTVTASIFTRNRASTAGGAIFVSDGAISRSRFTRNSAGEHGGAVALAIPNRDVLRQLRGNTFMRNAAPAGGAMTLGPCETPNRNAVIRVEGTNNFSGNRATEQRRTNNVWLWVGGCG